LIQNLGIPLVPESWLEPKQLVIVSGPDKAASCAVLRGLLEQALCTSPIVWLALPLYRPSWTLPADRYDFPLEDPETFAKIAERHGEPVAALCRYVRELQLQGHDVKVYAYDDYAHVSDGPLEIRGMYLQRMQQQTYHDVQLVLWEGNDATWPRNERLFRTRVLEVLRSTDARSGYEPGDVKRRDGIFWVNPEVPPAIPPREKPAPKPTPLPAPARALVQEIERLLTQLQRYVHVEPTGAGDLSHHDAGSWAPHYQASFSGPVAPLFAALLETWQKLNKYLEPMLRERPEETRAAFERAASRLSLLSTRDQYAWEGGNTTQVFELARQSLTRAIALAEGQSLPPK
jgi:hypothetical protein